MSARLVIVSAADPSVLSAELRRIAAYLDRVGDAELDDIAYTCALVRGPARVAFVSDSVADLRSRLVSAASRIEGGAERLKDKSGTYYLAEPLLGPGLGKLAFVYPGAAAYYPDMMRDIAISSDDCRSAFDELEEAMLGDAEFTPSSFLFPPAPYYRHDADVFSYGAFSQAFVASYAGSVAFSRLLGSCAIRPDGVVGFAGGDLAAVLRSGAAGVFVPRPDRIRLLKEIYDIVRRAVDHSGLPSVVMVTALLRHPGEEEPVVAALEAGRFFLATDLSPRQKAYVVATDYFPTFEAAFAAAGIRLTGQRAGRPFNTPLCKDMVPQIRRFVDRWMRKDPVCDAYSCARAEPMPTRLRKAREDVAQRWACPVRFRETILRMYEDGYRVFLEAGPRGQLTAAVSDTLRDVPHAAIAMNSAHRRGILQALHALAQLAAAGAPPELEPIFAARGARRLDFDSAFSAGAHRETEMRLSRAFPRLTLLSSDAPFGEISFSTEPKVRGGRAAARAAAVAAQMRRQRQFEFGSLNPLVSDADTVSAVPGVSQEIRKTFRLSDAPFIGDGAIGTSQLSYSDPNLRGLVTLTLPVAAEIMAEAAGMLVPNRTLVAVENLVSRRQTSFANGELTLFVLAERVASGDSNLAAVKVLMRDDVPDGAYTRPVMEATFFLASAPPAAKPLVAEPLAKPRSVHWSPRDIYPARLCCGRRLRLISFVEAWSEWGLDYEVEAPQLSGNVVFTRFPLWTLDPLLLQGIVSGFALWRSHERFSGAYSFPFRLRRLQIEAPLPKEGSRVKCYLRLTGVTPKSHLCDIAVSDGNGNAVMTVSGWEELVERIRPEYRELVMQPATSFVTKPVSDRALGERKCEVSSAFVTDVPYPVFERNGGIWLKTFSHIVLSAAERKEFAAKSGTVARRTEWLFGRLAAKEAVRRFLKDRYQARWSYADVQIFADDLGKPHAIGKWSDDLPFMLDVAIAHTARFVIALAVQGARAGVDVESAVRDLSEEFTAGVFTREELDLAASAPDAALACIRFWCAKEAVSKALGVGIRYSPKEMKVVAYDADDGRLAVRLTGAWDEAFRKLRGRDIEVKVSRMEDHVVAFCFLSETYFSE